MRVLQGGLVRPGRVEAEPQPITDDKPECPAWLNAYAREEWDRLSDELYGMGILATIDQTMFAAYCMAYARWRQAEEDLQVMADQDPATHAALLKTKEGNAIQNPLVGVANVARRDMARLAAEFGLSPSARVLLSGASKGGQDPREAKHFS